MTAPRTFKRCSTSWRPTSTTPTPGRHIKLWGMLEPGQPVPKRTVLLFTKAMRADFDVEVDGYSKGKLAVFSAP
ncbi:MAG: hypothetical protein R2705_11185 [Ilumatobacteraceae bacterium]